MTKSNFDKVIAAINNDINEKIQTHGKTIAASERCSIIARMYRRIEAHAKFMAETNENIAKIHQNNKVA